MSENDERVTKKPRPTCGTCAWRMWANPDAGTFWCMRTAGRGREDVVFMGDGHTRPACPAHVDPASTWEVPTSA